MKKQVLTRAMLVIASLMLLVITCKMWETQVLVNNTIAYLLIMIGVLTMEGCLTTPFNIEKSWRYKRWTTN